MSPVMADFDKVLAEVGHLMEPQEMYPPRYLVKEFPTEEELKLIGRELNEGAHLRLRRDRPRCAGAPGLRSCHQRFHSLGRLVQALSALASARANSKVFHRPGCKSAAKIAEKNLVRLRQSGRGDQSREDPLCRVFAVTGWDAGLGLGIDHRSRRRVSGVYWPISSHPPSR